MPYEPNVIPPWKVPEPPPSVQEAEVVEKPQESAKFVPAQETKTADVPKTDQVAVEEKKEHKYRAVRGSGDPIYLLVEGKKHWVLNADVYKKLGYSFGEEEKIEQSELATYLPGKPITGENWEEFK